MSEIYVKLSELSRPSTPVNDSDVVFISQLNNNENLSAAMSISDLRDILNFKNAYSTTVAGLAATTANQIFYVYTDNQKLSVNPYYNRNGVAEAIVDVNGNKLVYSTLSFMQQWFTYYGYSLIKEVPSIEDLRTLPVLIDGQKVKVRGFRAPSLYGGGEFVGRIGTATEYTGIVIVGPGFYWERANKNDFSLYDFGAYGDGTTDDTQAFKNLYNYFKSFPNSRVSRIDGQGRTYVLSEGITVDLSYFNIENMLLDFSKITASQIPTGSNLYAVTLTTSRRVNTEVFYRVGKMSGVEIIGPAFNGNIGSTLLAKIHGLYFKTDTSLNGFDAESVLIKHFHTAIVFSSHSYLLTFRKCRFLHCYAAVSDEKVVAGTTLTDRGENLSFEDCVFDMNVYNLQFNGTDSQWEIRFKECSFDYFGGYGNLGTIYPFDMSTTQLLFFTNCHFEWGNASSIVNNMFRCGGNTIVEINGGVIRPMSGGNYGTVPVFFYNTGTSVFLLDGVVVNRAGIDAWANYGLERSRIIIKDTANNVSAINNTNYPNTIYNLQDSGLAHPYSQVEFEVRGLDTETNTDPHTTARLSAVTSTITVDGVTYPSIAITKQSGYGIGSYCEFKLYADRTVQSGVLNSIQCSIIGGSSSNPRTITGSTGCIILKSKDSLGMYKTSSKSASVLGATIVLSNSATPTKFNDTPYLAYHRNGQQMNKVQLRLDLSGLGAGETIHLYKIFDCGPL